MTQSISLYPLWIFLCLTFLLSSVDAQVAVVGELSQEREVKPGESYNGTIAVRNDLDEPQEVKIYQTDYLFRFDGTNDYGEPGTVSRSNAPWITFSPSNLVIPPKSTVNVNYTVSVPSAVEKEMLIGTYWSMLIVEGIPKGSPESGLQKPNQRAQMGITQTIRYAVQIITNIRFTGNADIRFLGTKIETREQGARYFLVDIENRGERGVRPEVYLELYNETGSLKGKFSGVRMRIYPGTSIRQSFEITDVPKGTYRALVVVDSGGDDIIGAQYTLTL